MQAFKLDPHSFRDGIKLLYYPYCLKCGLVLLKNPLSEWARSHGCNHKEHPSWETVKAKYSPVK